MAKMYYEKDCDLSYLNGKKIAWAGVMAMNNSCSDIQGGAFAGNWIAENKNGRALFNSKRTQLKKPQVEIVGEELRKNMIWGGDSDLNTVSN